VVEEEEEEEESVERKHRELAPKDSPRAAWVGVAVTPGAAHT
jgi:hypothetical protein